MSAFLPSARRGSRPAPQSARGFVLYDGGDDAASDYDFVYDVSDDDVVERDIDAEIEARERANRATRAAVELATAPRAQLGQTMSQRMLSSLNQSRVKGSRAFSATAPYPATEKLADEPTPLPRSASRHGLDMFDAHGGRASSSCADRLEARISKSFLSRQESSSTEADDGHDMSALYSGRRTYPAESIKKADPRLSDTGPAPTPVETKMMALLAQERATRSADAFQREDPTPERDVSSDKGGVSFHFYGGSSIASRGQGMALTDGSADARAEPIRTSHAVVMPDRSRPQPLPAHVALASQLGEIETLVDGIERCMAVAALSSLADRVVGELELLKQSTQQIRSNGTTLILQEVGRQQTEATFALRRLVTRAVSVHKRIEDLILSVKRQAV